MSRFAATTIVFGLAAAGVAAGLTGPTRWLALSGLGLGYAVIFGLGVAFVQLRFFCDAVCRGAPGGNAVALTFDDGPDPAATPVLLDALKAAGARATFFVQGSRVLAHPELARRIVREGHVIANHTHNHFWWTNFMRAHGLSRQIDQCQRAVHDATGLSPALFRPPVGLTNPHLRRSIRHAGVTLVGWDVRSLDRTGDPRAIIDRILRRARDGSVILLHGAGDPERIRRITEAVVAGLARKDYRCVGLDELLGVHPYLQEKE